MATPLAKITAAAASHAKEVVETAMPNFRIGGKKVYLPNDVIAFIRPNKPMAPNMATFLVPLTFNKLDLRDYLWHVYNVRVTAVRSFVNQQGLQRKGTVQVRGPTHRPRSEKMMIAVLEQPFVWPDRPKGEDLPDEFEWEKWEVQERASQEQQHVSAIRHSMDIQLRTERQREVPNREQLAQDAKDLLEGRKEWKSDAVVDERWKGILEMAKKKGQ